MMAENTTEQTKALIDPSKPAQAVVEVHGDGSATRNDRGKLAAANTNAYYILMTAYGEQEGNDCFEIDQELHKKNRRMWNAWATQGLDDEERTKIAERLALNPKELAPLSNEERQNLTAILRERLKDNKAELPDPKGRINLSGLYFDRLVSADTFYFPKWANFEGATFGDWASFLGATFSERASFLGATFSKRADFEGATFSERASFLGATFSKRADFEGATFSERADFEGATFSDRASFEGATFSDRASFEGATFSDWASFEGATFSERADFEGATFSDWADFEGATFSYWADFEGATFSEEASFEGATFSDWADFEGATFSERASFEGATFSDWADFQGATFSDWADFQGATFSERAYFKNAVFNGTTNFSNAIFSSKTSFNEAKFQKYVPEFYESKLHQNTQFTTDKDYWPRIYEAIASDSKRAFTRLRQMMNELQKPDDEHFFFRQEMRCKARLEGRFYRATSTLFDWVSHYGHSIARPLAGLGLIILVPPIVYHVLYLLPCYACGAGEFWHDLALSFANTFAIFGFHKTYFDANTIKSLAWWIKPLSGLQTILGFAFLFLLGLGLRNRFRLR